MIPVIVSLLALGGLLLLSAAWLISDSLAERPLPMLTLDTQGFQDRRPEIVNRLHDTV
jgi:hypothetical protein